jgi:transposase-like protein
MLQDGVTNEVAPSDLRSALVRLGLHRVLQELLESEQRDFLRAERDDRADARRGQRTGSEPRHLETGEGRIERHLPQVRHSTQPFQSQLLAVLRGRTATLERLVSQRYAHGWSPATSRPPAPMRPAAVS